MTYLLITRDHTVSVRKGSLFSFKFFQVELSSDTVFVFSFGLSDDIALEV